MNRTCRTCAMRDEAKGETYFLCAWHGNAEILVSSMDIEVDCEGYKYKKK